MIDGLLRDGGAGMPTLFTQTGVGTMVAEGKEVCEFDGQACLMERSVPELWLVKAKVTVHADPENRIEKRTVRDR